MMLDIRTHCSARHVEGSTAVPDKEIPRFLFIGYGMFSRVRCGTLSKMHLALLATYSKNDSALQWLHSYSYGVQHVPWHRGNKSTAVKTMVDEVRGIKVYGSVQKS
eukprot:scaffold295_cov257-Pinguiococcus_pyrenoidosus.AAC.6